MITNIAKVVNGIVDNIIWGDTNDFSEADGYIDVTDTNVQIGDSYMDGCFYRDGERIYSEKESLIRANIILNRGIAILFGEEVEEEPYE